MSKKRSGQKTGKERGTKPDTHEALKQAEDNARQFDALWETMKSEKDTIIIKLLVSANKETAVFAEMLKTDGRYVVFFEAPQDELKSAHTELLGLLSCIGEIDARDTDSASGCAQGLNMIKEAAENPELNPELAQKFAEVGEKTPSTA